MTTHFDAIFLPVNWFGLFDAASQNKVISLCTSDLWWQFLWKHWWGSWNDFSLIPFLRDNG